MNIKIEHWKTKAGMYLTGGVIAFAMATAFVNHKREKEQVIKPLAQVCEGLIDQVKQVHESLLSMAETDDAFYYVFGLKDYSTLDYALQTCLRENPPRSVMTDKIIEARKALSDSILRQNVLSNKPAEMSVQAAVQMQRKCVADPRLERPVWLTHALDKTDVECASLCEEIDSEILQITGNGSDSLAVKQTYPEDIQVRRGSISAEMRLFADDQWHFNALYITDDDDRAEYLNRFSSVDKQLSAELSDRWQNPEKSPEADAEWLFNELCESLRRAILLRKLWQDKPSSVDFVTCCELVNAFENINHEDDLIYPDWFVSITQDSYFEYVKLSDPYNTAWTFPSYQNLDRLSRLRKLDRLTNN